MRYATDALDTRRRAGASCSHKPLMGADKPPAPNELIPGTLDMLVLNMASRGPMHGYAIAQSIQRLSRDVLRVEEGALYPALHRLEVRGLLRAQWGVSDNNRRAKFYSLTAEGRRELEREATSWARVSAAITRVMQPA
jgi:PadR family transcriptional regulator PadR